ncbi:MAG: hypothetical protein U5K79_01120 [Cyclobacteriaceae bacterium]|nr:hypothetical protein [Cyclobacteriaceae bacterium]
MYEQAWITKGPIVSADGLLYCYEERTGNVALVNPNPEKFEIISTFKIAEGSGPHWAHPYIKDGKLLIRHGDVLMVFNIGTTYICNQPDWRDADSHYNSGCCWYA